MFFSTVYWIKSINTAKVAMKGRGPADFRWQANFQYSTHFLRLTEAKVEFNGTKS